MANGTRTITCACGEVAVEVVGPDIVTATCYCDDCQAAGHKLEALPHHPHVVGPDGGTPYVLHRSYRIRVVRGADRLRPDKLRPQSPSSRMVATCCDTPMYIGFDRGPHWVSIYRDRFGADAPPVTARVQTKFAPDPAAVPDDVPASPGYSSRLLWPLATSFVAMKLGL